MKERIMSLHTYTDVVLYRIPSHREPENEFEQKFASPFGYS